METRPNIPIRIKEIVQDITERKKAEGRIQALADAVESSDDAIITETPEGIITSWNKGAEQIYGYSVEEILGKNVSILEPDNLVPLQKIWLFYKTSEKHRKSDIYMP